MAIKDNWDATTAEEGAVAVGVKAKAADLATALGTKTQATGLASISIGMGSEAKNEGSVAIGVSSESAAKNSFAIGTQSQASSEDSIAIGTKAGTKDSTTAVNAIAIGKDAQATAKNAISVGTSNAVSGQNSGAIGNPSVVQGTNSYSLGNNNAIGSASDHVLTLGGQNNVGATATRDSSGVITNMSTLTQKQNADRAFVLGYKNTIAATADASDSMVIGNENTVNAKNTMVLGNKVTVTAANNVILGHESGESSATTTSGTANNISNGTVNGITYGSFAGMPVGVVSVGATTKERQIINVAAGKISNNSTDAINGSQLYLTQNVLGNVAKTTKNIIGGETALNPNTGELTANNIGDTKKSTVHDAIKAVKSTVMAGTNMTNVGVTENADGSKIYTVNANGTTVSKGSDAVTVTSDKKDANNITNYKVDLSDATKAQIAKEESVDGDNGNITVTENGTNSTGGKKYKVALKHQLNLGNTGSVKAGNTTINTNGVTINNGPSFTKNKVDVAGNKITNVANGDISTTSTDAVNGSQLHNAINNINANVNARINDVADDANAGVSSAMAMAALPQAYLPGKSMLTGGMATYNGEGAVAVGFSKLSDNGRWVLKMSGSADTQGNAGAAVGVGFHF